MGVAVVRISCWLEGGYAFDRSSVVILSQGTVGSVRKWGSSCLSYFRDGTEGRRTKVYSPPRTPFVPGFDKGPIMFSTCRLVVQTSRVCFGQLPPASYCLYVYDLFDFTVFADYESKLFSCCVVEYAVSQSLGI